MIQKVDGNSGPKRSVTGHSLNLPELEQSLTFYFQAWHINVHAMSESYTHNKQMAEYVEREMKREWASLWTVRASAVRQVQQSLAVPISVSWL